MIKALKKFFNWHKPVPLPDKPSDLIRLAMLDLAKVEADPFYKVDMSDWHNGGRRNHPVCHVCLAGAVMARSLKTPFEADITPAHFDGDIPDKLAALDEFRQGEIAYGLSSMRLEKPDGLHGYMDVPSYERSPEKFRISMIVMADILEEHGL